MREISCSTRFKRDYKLMKKRGTDMDKINSVIFMLANDEELPSALCDHPLSGNWSRARITTLLGAASSILRQLIFRGFAPTF